MSSAPPIDRFYRSVRAIARFWLWFFFKAVDTRHAERVPRAGPVLLCANHPNNLIDSLVLGAVLARKVHYLATATLFRHPLLRRFLLAAGAIPVWRRQDSARGAAGRDPAAPDPNADMFAACAAAFEQGAVVAIYPEGTTHAEARVQRIKTGAARIALGWESARPGTLAMIPVGLTFEARKSFRARVLVSFGEPLPVGAYVEAYRADPVKGIDALTTHLQEAMEAQVVNVARIDDARLLRAVEELYRDVLAREVMELRGLAPRQVDPLRLSQSIVEAIGWFKAREPARVEALWQRIQAYRSLLAQHRVRDDTVRARRERLPAHARLVYSWDAVAGFPLFVYGALGNALPYLLPRMLAQRLAGKETDYATIRLLASIVAYPLFYALETALVLRLAGSTAAVIFAVSLPISGVIAYRYLAGAGRLRSRLRFNVLAVTQAAAARRLVAERAEILAELERAKSEWLAATKGSSF
ncbi:MAG TPA: lysophospholipid acyltransferase family protein [Methylomirabilota bacterium]|nr:lysophospholipid acyltransferase family protein [Methylomirabilota bacterium]